MNKKFVTGVAVLAVAAVALAYWWQQRAEKAPAMATAAPGAGAGKPGGGGPATVEVGRVQRLRLVDDAISVGTLSSRRGVVIRPEVSGRIAALGFTEGQRVRRGQLMVQLDDSLQQAQLRQAEAQEALSRSQWQRNRDLAAQNFVSQNAVDQSAAALEVAQAQVALARAQRARMRIDAPFDGIAGVRQVEVGDFIKDGADIVAVEDLSQLWVDYQLPERYLARLKSGQVVELTLDAMAGQRFTARVEVLDAQVDVNGRTLRVRARLDNRDGALRPGMFARTRTVFGVRENALVVPEEALVPQGGKQYLIKVVDGEKGKVSERLEAKIGARVPGRVEILEGVADGDMIVVAGQDRLMRGEAMPLRIVQLGGPAGGASAPARAASDGANQRAPV